MELEVEGRRPVGWPKKTWIKVVETKDMRKLNNKEDIAKEEEEEEEKEDEKHLGNKIYNHVVDSCQTNC